MFLTWNPSSSTISPLDHPSSNYPTPSTIPPPSIPPSRRAFRSVDQRLMSTSMYEVFNWGSSPSSAGHHPETRPNKRYSLAIAGSHINIDDVPDASAVVVAPSVGDKHNHRNHHQLTAAGQCSYRMGEPTTRSFIQPIYIYSDFHTTNFSDHKIWSLGGGGVFDCVFLMFGFCVWMLVSMFCVHVFVFVHGLVVFVFV